MKGIDLIHQALVEHNDPYPKNILLLAGAAHRVVWIDFDVAITYDIITPKAKEYLNYETEVVKATG